MNADPRVMEHFPAPLSQNESDATIAHIEAHLDQHGFGLWAVEILGVAPFAGFIGLSIPTVRAHFTPCVEIGWRLAADFWGGGYATEGRKPPWSLGWPISALSRLCRLPHPPMSGAAPGMEKLG